MPNKDIKRRKAVEELANAMIKTNMSSISSMEPSLNGDEITALTCHISCNLLAHAARAFSISKSDMLGIMARCTKEVITSIPKREEEENKESDW